MQQAVEIRALLEWQLAMGVDEAIGEQPRDHFMPPPPAPVQPAEPARAAIIAEPPRPTMHAPAALSPSSAQSLAEVIESAENAARAAKDLNSLKQAVSDFNGCNLKKTARNMVFADGNANSDIMLIGEAPGADEDRQGIPFCGASGQLLDKMLAAIDLKRSENCYITNTLFWRPPGNRTPTPEELAICRPFVERHIELFAPKMLIFVGGTAGKSLLGETRGVMKLRGQSLTYTHPNGTAIHARVIFHPSYLLRQPAQKRLAWADLLAIRALLDSE